MSAQLALGDDLPAPGTYRVRAWCPTGGMTRNIEASSRADAIEAARGQVAKSWRHYPDEARTQGAVR